MAMNMFLKFKIALIQVDDNTRKTLMKYSLVAYMVPTVIIAVTTLLNEYDICDIGYGKHNICFIYNFYPRLYFYIIPYTLVFSGSCFLRFNSLYLIRKQEHEARKKLTGSSRQHKDLLAISLKIILTLGITEIIGFIQISKHNLSANELIFNSIFAVLYTILRSLRGLFLFMMYVVNKQKLTSMKHNINQIKNLLPKQVETSSTQV